MTETNLGAGQPATMDDPRVATPRATGTPAIGRDPVVADPAAPGPAVVAPARAADEPYGPPGAQDPYEPIKLGIDNIPDNTGPSLRDHRGHIMLVLGEFFGTFFFLWPSFMVAQVANQYEFLYTQPGSQPNQVLMIAFGFALSFLISFLLFNRYSGANLNPAVTLTLLGTGKLSPIKACFMWIGQFIAALAAAGAASAMTPGPVAFANSLGGNCSKSRGLFIEVFATTALCTTVLFVSIEKYAGVGVSGGAIAIALFLGHLVSVYYTGAGLNPARSLGAAIAAKSFDNYHWIYWLGPIIGAGLSVGIWHLFKISEGEDARKRANVEQRHCP